MSTTLSVWSPREIGAIVIGVVAFSLGSRLSVFDEGAYRRTPGTYYAKCLVSAVYVGMRIIVWYYYYYFFFACVFFYTIVSHKTMVVRTRTPIVTHTRYLLFGACIIL